MKQAKLPFCWKPIANANPEAIAKNRSFEWTARSETTSSTVFRSISALRTLKVCTSGEVAATISLELTGEPAGIRVWLDRRHVMHPGAVRFVPAGPHDSFSLRLRKTYIQYVAKTVIQSHFNGVHPTGFPTTLERGTIELRYHHSDCTSSSEIKYSLTP